MMGKIMACKSIKAKTNIKTIAYATLLMGIFNTNIANAATAPIELKVDSYILGFVADDISKSLNENIGKEVIIKIDSVGGPELSSLRLANAITAHGNVTLKIDGQCTNTCANLIIPAANKVIITKGSIISFASNSLQEYNVMASSGYKPSDDLTSKATKINEFYKSHKVNDAMMFCSWKGRDPFLRNGQNGQVEIAYNGKPSLLNLKNLKDFGIKNISEITSPTFAKDHEFLVSQKFLSGYMNYDDIDCKK